MSGQRHASVSIPIRKAQKHQLLYEKLHVAATEYLQGQLTQDQIADKHQVSSVTFRRYLRKHDLRLSREQIVARRCRQHPAQPRAAAPRPHRRPETPTVVLGRRFCTVCKHWRHLVDFHVRDRDAEDNAIAWQSICATCQRIRLRYNAGMKRRGKPFGPRQPRMTPEQRLARARELYAVRRQDPAWLELRREYERFYTEARRRQAGVPRAEARLARRNIGRDPMWKTAPFIAWAEERKAVYGSWEDLACVCGLFTPQGTGDHRSLARVMTQDEVHASFIDHCLQHEGTTSIVTLYPKGNYEPDEALLELAA